MTHQLVSDASYFYKDKLPQIIAHRGASGIYPEHTLPSHKKAMHMGSDFIEPDLQPTKDHRLIVIHDWLNETTNVSEFPEFSSRLTTKTINGEQITEWFPEDFTIHELKRLKRKQRYESRDQKYNWIYGILTLEEFIEMAIEENKKIKEKKKQKLVGAYLEVKFAQYFESLGFNVNQMLLDVLKKYDLDTIKGCQDVFPIVIQNFEEKSLRFFRDKTDLPLVYLTENPDNDFTEIAKFCHGISPPAEFILGNNFVNRAHDMLLVVVAWTILDDNLQFADTACEQYHLLKKLKVDAIFVEFPESAYNNFIKVICEGIFYKGEKRYL